MKKLKILLTVSIIALMVALSVSCNKDEKIALDFDITVPANWNHFVLANQGLVYSAQRNPENEMDTLREYLYVYKESSLTNYDLSSYYNALKPIITAGSLYVSTLAEKDTTINGTNFKRLISKEIEYYANAYYDSIDINMISTRYFFFEKNNGYYLTMVTVDTCYNKIKPIFDGIIGSFQYKY